MTVVPVRGWGTLIAASTDLYAWMVPASSQWPRVEILVLCVLALLIVAVI
jgi:hypothetical protein